MKIVIMVSLLVIMNAVSASHTPSTIYRSSSSSSPSPLPSFSSSLLSETEMDQGMSCTKFCRDGFVCLNNTCQYGFVLLFFYIMLIYSIIVLYKLHLNFHYILF